MKDVFLDGGLVWILVVCVLPLFRMMWVRVDRSTTELHERIDKAEAKVVQANESLAAYKLEVAKQYASIAYLKDVERRLTSHLTRIEKKLDERERLVG